MKFMDDDELLLNESNILRLESAIRSLDNDSTHAVIELEELARGGSTMAKRYLGDYYRKEPNKDLKKAIEWQLNAIQEKSLWAYADCGRVEGEWFYHHATVGTNLRMTEWQGAVLQAQLDRFPEQNRVRNANAIALNAALDALPGIRSQQRDPRMNSQGNYCFVFHYDSAEFAGLPLQSFERALEAEGIPMSVSYPSLSDLSVFRNQNFGPRRRDHAPRLDYTELQLPRAEQAAASTVWLQHRLLLASLQDTLDVALAVEKIHDYAARIAESLRPAK